MGGVEVGDVGIDICIPVVVEVVTQFQITAILFKTHSRAVVVGASVLCRDGAAELAASQLVGGFCLNGAVAAGAKINAGLHAVFLHRACHDIHHAAHGIRAVEHRCRTAKHFNTLCHQRLIAVGNGMSVDALILRVPVDEHEQLACTAGNTAQVDAAGASRRNAIAHH